ncbi:1359_t:CDS:2, partial [Racocetra persica]
MQIQKDESKELSEVDLLMTRIVELEYIIEENAKREAYILLCHHIFYEQLCGTNILMPEAWGRFQRTFEESGMEVYQTHDIVEVPVVQRSPAEKVAEKSQLKM